MSELLPGYQATRLRAGLIDYLTTTFALVDSDAQAALRALLEDESEGMFKGPYLRIGMPFSGPTPGHLTVGLDALRLRHLRPPGSSVPAALHLNSDPQPTMVATGTNLA